ncbi:MAG TPA: pyridoxal-phosphate dependent enzyme, partial [Candidatus Limnocylindrales bacterium]
TAAAASRVGLEAHIVVGGPPVEGSPNLGLMEQLGATVHQTATDSRAEREAMVNRVASDARAAGRHVKVLPVGGSEPAGAWGHVLAAIEVAGQAATHGFEPAAIILPTATGGTQAGLIVGSALAFEKAPRIAGILVARTADELRPIVAGLVDELAAMAGIATPAIAIEIDDTHLGGGYGEPSVAASKAAVMLARTEGVLVDPVYTAKGLAGLIALVRSGAIDGEHAIFWHGGGLPALFEPR